METYAISVACGQVSFIILSVSAIVSSVIALITMRACLFLDNTELIIGRIIPEVPPINTWVGGSRSSKIPGAVPFIISILEVLWSVLFCSISLMASSFFSIE